MMRKDLSNTDKVSFKSKLYSPIPCNDIIACFLIFNAIYYKNENNLKLSFFNERKLLQLGQWICQLSCSLFTCWNELAIWTFIVLLGRSLCFWDVHCPIRMFIVQLECSLFYWDVHCVIGRFIALMGRSLCFSTIIFFTSW